MAAPAFAFTISRAAEMLAENEQLLWDLADEMDPEDAASGSMVPTTSRPSHSRLPGWNICGSCSRSTNAIGHPGGPERMVTACRERCRVLFRSSLAKMHRALVSQHFQPCPVEQGAGDRGDAQGDPAIHAGEDIVAAREKAVRVLEKLRGLRLTRAAELAEAGVEETLAYYGFPEEHWRRIRTNNPLERILREIRRRTRVVGAFPDGQSALNLAAAKLRHIAGTAWSTKRYLNIELLKDQQMRGAITA
jgi:hypothetical protein